jgi:hypothetical protein
MIRKAKAVWRGTGRSGSGNPRLPSLRPDHLLGPAYDT